MKLIINDIPVEVESLEVTLRYEDAQQLFNTGETLIEVISISGGMFEGSERLKVSYIDGTRIKSYAFVDKPLPTYRSTSA